MSSASPTFRQYVRTGEWADESTQLATCYTNHMAKAVEIASYTGDQDTDRYYTLIDGKMVEVTFRHIPDSAYTDDSDYMHGTYGVYPVLPSASILAGHPMADTSEDPIDTFHVRIDGRA